jgi:hypothetical protein
MTGGAPGSAQEAHAHSLAAAAAAHQAAAAVAAAAAAGYVPLSAFTAHSLQANNYTAQLAAALQHAGPFSPTVTSHAAYLPAHLLHIYPPPVDHSTTVSGSDEGTAAGAGSVQQGGGAPASPPQEGATLAKMGAPRHEVCGEYPPAQDWAGHTSSLLTSLTAVAPVALLARAAGGGVDQLGADEATCTSSPSDQANTKHRAHKASAATKSAPATPVAGGHTPASSTGGSPTSVISFSRRPRKQARPLPCS